MSPSPDPDVMAVQDIAVLSSILRVVLETTGMGFAAVARVTEDRWLACEVLDPVGFGLKPGDELPIKTTLCDEVRAHHAEIVIDHVAEDPDYAEHHTPKLYGLQSYISVPITLADGSFFGTLCAIDARPVKLKDTAAHQMFKLFAELIGRHLDEQRITRQALADLAEAQAMAELREQFMAVLGHDLKNPITAVQSGTRMLLKEPQSEKGQFILHYMGQTAVRMNGLVDNVLDLARCTLGGGLHIDAKEERPLRETFDPLVGNTLTAHPGRTIEAYYDLPHAVLADHERLGQLFSSLLSNALIHGEKDGPVVVRAATNETQLILSVENHGAPIPEQDRARLFQPFYRGDATRSKGLGLGLFIATQIAKAHGGHIDLRCEEGRTIFTFTMPLKRRHSTLVVAN
jgi:signal transduction histidine kinase